ncbi:putative ribonuclease H-like domain-containing protein [Senna tora]|uniref:Putative ribonuclease H-like domain-containing protein n=1 Tax=Senna tora TaxID=362788 RepID=A0A834WL20_9FABA|nr:putative ribonuclease H-like domain-containing protein [Senna tora]
MELEVAEPPECGSLKFNVDGSCWRHNNSISCGGVLRDSDGRWITGFVRRMGKGNSLTAEMWAIYSSLQIAWDNRLKDIIIETDSLLAITLIKDGVDRFHPLKPLVSAICNLADRIGNINFTHSFREGNRVANALASSGHCMDFGLYSLDIPPSSCILLVEDDIRGVLFPRGFAG